MKALTIKQPWASLIAHGLKSIENRTWKTNYRGRILIHAASTPVKEGWDALNEMQLAKVYAYKDKIYGGSEELPYGAILGSVEIVDCVKNHPSVWAEEGVWNWVLANPVLFDEPITGIKGKLSFWEYDGELPQKKQEPQQVVSKGKPVKTLKELQESAFLHKVADGVQMMIDNLTLNEQMRVSFVPLILEQIAWIYAEKAMACEARDKVSLLKKLSRTLKLVHQKWNDNLRQDLDFDHMKNVNEQVDVCVNNHLAHDLMILYWTVNREFKRAAPEYPHEELRTYAIISTLFIDLLKEYNLKIDELLAEKLKKKDLEPSVIPPIIKELRKGMVAFAGVEGKFNYENSDVKLGMDIIGKKIERIEFGIFGKDGNN